jgi:hypothetical protein
MTESLTLPQAAAAYVEASESYAALCAGVETARAAVARATAALQGHLATRNCPLIVDLADGRAILIEMQALGRVAGVRLVERTGAERSEAEWRSMLVYVHERIAAQKQQQGRMTVDEIRAEMEHLVDWLGRRLAGRAA